MSAWLVGSQALGAAEWFALLLHFLMLSLLAVGGAITTAPDMHRFVVGERGWLDDAQFSASVALAQAAPGPNVMFVAVIGFNVDGLAGAAATLIGTLAPSSLLTLQATRWAERHRETLLVRAFTTGMAPITLGLLLATGVVLFEPALHAAPAARWSAAALALLTLLLMLRTRLNPLLPIAIGALVGGLGWVG